jgi:hypothetical protein
MLRSRGTELNFSHEDKMEAMADDVRVRGTVLEGEPRGDAATMALGFEDLPPEVQCGVFAHLGVQELGQVLPRVSQSWRQLALTDTLWLHHLRHRYPSIETSTWYPPPPCRVAFI